MSVSSDNSVSIGAHPPALARRDLVIVLICLFTLTALAWLYLLQNARGMATQNQAWGVRDALYSFAMWSAMMAGMMLPGASPMVLLNAAIERKAQGRTGAPTVVFVLSYLIVWTLFSAIATALQGSLQRLRLLTDNGLTHAMLGGAVLIVAGLYRRTALKTPCLDRCRSPLAFLLQRWRPGLPGALRLGFAHGAYCLGCCWALMLLLFVGGVMNFLWAAGLGALTLLEKVLPVGRLTARLFDVRLVSWGVWTLIGARLETIPALLEMRR